MCDDFQAVLMLDNFVTRFCSAYHVPSFKEREIQEYKRNLLTKVIYWQINSCVA